MQIFQMTGRSTGSISLRKISRKMGRLMHWSESSTKIERGSDKERVFGRGYVPKRR